MSQFIDYAQLIKLYGESLDREHRYSPAECTGTEKRRMRGFPDHKHIFQQALLNDKTLQ